MFICFLCKHEFETIQDLFYDFKLHGLRANSNIECCQNQCPQTFKSFSHFKRHLLNVHQNDINVKSTENQLRDDSNKCMEENEISNTFENKNNIIKNIPAISTNTNFDNFQNKIDIHECKQLIRTKYCTFLSHLYARPNLSRKNVTDIQCLTQSLISSIVNNLTELLVTDDRLQDLIISKVNSIRM